MIGAFILTIGLLFSSMTAMVAVRPGPEQAKQAAPPSPCTIADNPSQYSVLDVHRAISTIRMERINCRIKTI